LHPCRKTIKRQHSAWLKKLRPELMHHVVLIYTSGILSMKPFRLLADLGQRQAPV